jgi:polyhydroxybutyrate depolymerase
MLSLRLGFGGLVAAGVVGTIFACVEEPSSKRESRVNVDGSASTPDDPTGVTPSEESSSGAVPSFNVVSQSLTMDFGGRQRRYVLQMPKTYDSSKSYPLVMIFHGSPGNAESMAKSVPFDDASKGEAIIVYPQAGNQAAAENYYDWDLYTPTQNNIDMNWIVALVDAIKDQKNIDKTRTLAFGFSGGAFFTTQMACRFSGLFKAISVNSGGGPEESQMNFQKRANGCYVCPGGAVATLVIHGQADDQVVPTSGAFTSQCFAATNGCGDSASAVSPSPCEAYDGCPAKSPVRRCFIPDQKHAVWPSAMDQSWSFFRSLP